MAFFLACDSFVNLLKYDFVCISILLAEKEARSCGEYGNHGKRTADTLVKEIKTIRLGLASDLM